VGSAHPGLPEPLVIPVGQAQLCGVRLGAGGTPRVVFLHAGIADHRAWTAVLERLAPTMDVIAYDRRGFGTSTCQPEAHDQVVDLAALLDAAGLERPVLVGNSMGGLVALDFALAHPERVSALVLVAPAVSGAPETEVSDVTAEEAAMWEALEAAEAAGDLETLNRGELRIWLDGPTAPEGRVDGPRRELAYDMNRIALAAESPGHEPTARDAWSRLGDVACPVLLVVGDLDMSHMQTRSRELSARIPGARLEVMPGAGHLPGLEQPEAFADLLVRFLADVLPDAPPDALADGAGPSESPQTGN
jgi:pimeloyl-ACP methyl ester carboxylesterase